MSETKGYRSKSGSRAENAFEWLEVHSKEAFWALVAVLVLVGGIWFYQKAQVTQARNASVALDDAEQALNSGNLPLAQANLEKLVQRYGDTPAGKVGLILLAQVHYQKGEFQQGVDALKPLATSDDPYFATGALGLAGAGLEQLKKYAEASQSYEKAAAKARFESERASYMGASARVLMAAGKAAEAKAIWMKLASDPSGPMAAEARVRLGEMDGKPIS
jgi:predicted negative regulator of RcsB-dependent stress response